MQNKLGRRRLLTLEREGQLKALLRILQAEMNQWKEDNFPCTTADQQFYGVVEEVGELAHALLKQKQGIRNNEEHVANAKDAVGDIVVFLCQLCSEQGWSFGEILIDVWREVRKRDWVKYPKTGFKEAIADG